MAKAIHMMVRVLEERRSVDFYAKAFGLEIADRFDFDDFTLVYLRNPENDFEIELTVNKGRTQPYQHGDGYGHVAFAVDDLDAEHRRFRGARAAAGRHQGVSPRRRPDGAVLLRAGPGRLQDRGAAAPRPLPVARSARPAGRPTVASSGSATIWHCASAALAVPKSDFSKSGRRTKQSGEVWAWAPLRSIAAGSWRRRAISRLVRQRSPRRAAPRWSHPADVGGDADHLAWPGGTPDGHGAASVPARRAGRSVLRRRGRGAGREGGRRILRSRRSWSMASRGSTRRWASPSSSCPPATS